jgi:hypothetical protein
MNLAVEHAYWSTVAAVLVAISKKPMTELSAAMIGFWHLYVKARLLAMRGLSTVRAAIRSWSRR